MKKYRRLLLALLIGTCFSPAGAAADLNPGKGLIFEETAGSIRGRVVDGEVKSPIPNVRIEVRGIGISALTDEEGRFVVPDVPAGSHVLEASVRFYTSRSVPDVIVKPGRATLVDIELWLSEDFSEREEVTVTAAFFDSGGNEPAGAAAFSYEEIRRAAGSAGDVSRIISGLPSVARTNDMANTLVVRGGSPDENTFYLDNIEIPNINHYPRLGASIGSMGLLNVDFIRDVRFYSGGFSPAYGDCLSSVTDIQFREGNREKFDFQWDLSMMGVGMVAEGPLAKEKGSWMFSARRSYVDLLIELMGQGVPVSWSDFQGKMTFDPAPGCRLTLLGILGIDDSGTEKEDALKDGESFFGGLDTTESAAGINWFQSWGKRGYSNTSLSMVSTEFISDSYHTVSESLAREGRSRERAFNLRNRNLFRLGRTAALEFGFEFRNILNRYDLFAAAAVDVLGNPVPEARRDLEVSTRAYGMFAQLAWTPFPRLTFRLGARGDAFSYNRNRHVSPRISAGLQLSRRTSLEISAGVFRQHLPLVLQIQSDSFRGLRDPFAAHLVLGLRHLLSENTRLTFEVYDKEYRRFPLDPDLPALFVYDEVFTDGFFSEHAGLIDRGRARSRGVEILIQKKLAERFYGVAGAAFSRARYRGLDGIWRDRVYDNRVILSLEGGYKAGDRLQFGLKWTYAGGMPYTPFDTAASAAAGSGVFETLRFNRERMAPYHSLNLRVDKRFFFGKSNMILYLSVWNVFNRKNPYAYYWNTIESRPDFVYGWGLLPVLGLEFEF